MWTLHHQTGVRCLFAMLNSLPAFSLHVDHNLELLLLIAPFHSLCPSSTLLLLNRHLLSGKKSFQAPKKFFPLLKWKEQKHESKNKMLFFLFFFFSWKIAIESCLCVCEFILPNPVRIMAIRSVFGYLLKSISIPLCLALHFLPFLTHFGALFYRIVLSPSAYFHCSEGLFLHWWKIFFFSHNFDVVQSEKSIQPYKLYWMKHFENMCQLHCNFLWKLTI